MKFSASAKWAWGALYIGAAIVLFAWFLFPSDLAKQAIVGKIEALAPGIEMRIGTLRPIFPPGAGLENVRFYRDGHERVRVDDLKMTPDILSAMGGPFVISFQGALYGGDIDGDIQFEMGTRRGGVFFNSYFSGIDLKKHPEIQRIPGDFVLGPLNGRLSYKTEDGGRSGIGRLDLESFDVTFSPAIFGFNGVAFDYIEIEALVKGDQVTIKRCSMKGAQADIEISGSATRTRANGDGGLNLTGVAVIKDSGQNGMLGAWLSQGFSGADGVGFSIRGSFSKPVFSLR